MPAIPAAQLVALAGPRLPDWVDPYLAAAGEDFFASRLWFDLTLAHALPASAEPLLARCGPDDAALLVLMREKGRLSSLATPYSLAWRPLFAAAPDPAAGRSLARLLRLRPPMQLELLDPADPAVAALRAGLSAGGIRALAYDHVGNWHETLPPGTGWEAYLAARPPALRTTVGRKLKRAGRELRFERADAPGPALEAGIAAYESVRAASWKPHEPFPDFDAALLRAAAAAGVAELGVLRQATDSQPVAAQYWILDRGGRRATVLKLAHAERARAASPGTVLTALMIRHLLEKGVQDLDFGRGDDDYKQLWVGKRRQRIGLVLADPLHPTGALAVIRQRLAAWRRATRAAAGAQDVGNHRT